MGADVMIGKGLAKLAHSRFGLPVKYVGVGEQADDLALFEPDPFVDAMFDEMNGG